MSEFGNSMEQSKGKSPMRQSDETPDGLIRSGNYVSNGLPVGANAIDQEAKAHGGALENDILSAQSMIDEDAIKTGDKNPAASDERSVDGPRSLE